jgi:peptidoglycan/xylan/chitin deacetylase (PgdA/CDA1 family)
MKRRYIFAIAGLVLLVCVGAVLFPKFTMTRVRAEIGPFDDTLRRIRIPTLMYHYISVPPPNADKYRLDLSVTPENFRKQMQWLKTAGYTTITAEEFVGALKAGAPLPPRPVLLTFDDGYEDAYTTAFPILREFGFVGTFFVVTDWVDQQRRGYLSWDQIKTMAAAGMSIHSHSRDHLDVRDRDEAWHVYHIAATYATLEAHLGPQLKLFCYPSGRFDERTVQHLMRVGVVAAFTTQDGTFATSDSNMWRLPRVRLRGETSVEEFGRLVRWER